MLHPPVVSTRRIHHYQLRTDRISTTSNHLLSLPLLPIMRFPMIIGSVAALFTLASAAPVDAIKGIEINQEHLQVRCINFGNFDHVYIFNVSQDLQNKIVAFDAMANNLTHRYIAELNKFAHKLSDTMEVRSPPFYTILESPLTAPPSTTRFQPSHS